MHMIQVENNRSGWLDVKNRHILLVFCLRMTQDVSQRRRPGALVPGSAGLCRTLPHVESPQDPPVRALSAGGVPVQAASQGRGPDSPAAGLGAVPTHEE